MSRANTLSMQPMEASQIKDRVKAFVSISDLADVFDMSRPTLYALMDDYDNKDTEGIPDHIMDFFDLVSGSPDSEEVRLYLSAKGTPKDPEILRNLKVREQSNSDQDISSVAMKIDNLEDLLNNSSRALMKMMDELHRLESEAAMVDRLIDMNPEDKEGYMAKRNELEAKIATHQVMISEIQNEKEVSTKELTYLRQLMFSLERSRAVGAAKRSAEGDVWNDDRGLKTMSVGSNGKAMVIFQMPPDMMGKVPFTVTVTAYLNSSDDFVELGRYHPEPEKNFVVIDDILSKLQVYYSVSVTGGEETAESGRYPLRFK